MIVFMYTFCLIVWGLNFIAVKLQGTPVSLEESLFFRLTGAWVLFFMFAMIRPQGLKVRLKDIPFLSIFGMCNFALSYLALYYATNWSTAALVTLIFSTKTVMTPVALRIFLGDRLHPKIIIGGMFGFLGVLVLLFPTFNIESHGQYMWGAILAFVGTILTAMGDAASARNSRRDINPITANCFGFFIAMLFMAIVSLFQGSEFQIPMEVTYMAALLYLTVIASFFTWLFYLKLVGAIGAAKSGYMVALFPVVGGTASIWMGESDLNIFFVMGCTLSSLGAILALGIPQFSLWKRAC